MSAGRPAGGHAGTSVVGGGHNPSPSIPSMSKGNNAYLAVIAGYTLYVTYGSLYPGSPASWCPKGIRPLRRRKYNSPQPSLAVVQIQASAMKHTCTHISDSMRPVHLLKIDDLSITRTTIRNTTDYCIKSRCKAGGYGWEIRFYPAYICHSDLYWISLQLVFLSADGGDVTANLSGRLVDPSVHIQPSQEKTVSKRFQNPLDCSDLVYLGSGRARDVAQAPVSFTVECTITVLRDRKPIPLPPSDLQQHLGELLQCEAGADVTFTVSGESFAAHKSILAARSPVFMAEFFGQMEEKRSGRVEIKDMEASVFKAMLQFVYTDEVPELECELKEKLETATAMTRHLLVAADRYGLDKLKVMCERRLALDIDASTAASTSALAEQHNCTQLKAKCVEFITGGSTENLDAVLATEGYKHLEESSPSLLTDLLKAAHGNMIISRSTDAK